MSIVTRITCKGETCVNTVYLIILIKITAPNAHSPRIIAIHTTPITVIVTTWV